MLRHCVAVLYLFAVFAGPVAAQRTVTAGHLGINIDQETILPAREYTDDGGKRVLYSADLHLLDGKTGQPIVLQSPRLIPTEERDHGHIVYETDLPLEITLKMRPEGRVVEWEITCTNTGTEQLWLEIGPALNLVSEISSVFFDGWDDLADPQERVYSERLAGNFPVACFSNSLVSLGVGLAPETLVSYLRHEYAPGDNSSGRLSSITRLVVDPQAAESVRFVLIGAPGEWGKYEIFEAYYESYPKWFRANPETDPRVSLNSSKYRAWPAGPWSPEIIRRHFAGWEWCYAPFRRTGDIYGHEDLWEYEPARPMDAVRGKARDEYFQWRAEAFSRGEHECNTAMLFYIPSQVWCEERLARERYADALTTDPKAKTHFTTPWVTGHDNELRVFPYKTSFAEQSYRDINLLAQELDLSGFAFDTAGGTARYTGPALAHLEARAWDDEVGVYCSELIAITRLMQYVRSIRKNGRALAVVSNPMEYGSYASVFHSDSAMLERNPWAISRTTADRLRWKLGHKTGVWWEDYDVADFVDTDQVNAEQLRNVYRGLADFTLLQSLRLGFIPPPTFTQGHARLTRWLPVIMECAHAGWQPVPAALTREPLWAARYGSGVQTLLVVAHEEDMTLQDNVRVQNRRMFEGALVFGNHDGTPLPNRVSDGDTVIPLEIDVREPQVLRAQCGVIPAAALSSGEVEVASDLQSAHTQATLNGHGAAQVVFRVPQDMMPLFIEWDGRQMPHKWCRERVTVQGTLRGKSVITAHFVSRYFRLDTESLLGFSFVQNGAPACTIVIPDSAVEAEQKAARRLQEYFRYWTGRIENRPEPVLIPIAHTSSRPAGSRVQVRLRDMSPPRVSQAGSDIVIEAGTEAQLQQLTDMVLRTLDSRYWTPDMLPGTALHQRLGLGGAVIE